MVVMRCEEGKQFTIAIIFDVDPILICCICLAEEDERMMLV